MGAPRLRDVASHRASAAAPLRGAACPGRERTTFDLLHRRGASWLPCSRSCTAPTLDSGINCKCPVPGVARRHVPLQNTQSSTSSSQSTPQESQIVDPKGVVVLFLPPLFLFSFYSLLQRGHVLGMALMRSANVIELSNSQKLNWKCCQHSTART